MGPQTWTCVHCNLPRMENEILWGTHATTIPGDFTNFKWKPECIFCRPDAPPPTLDLVMCGCRHAVACRADQVRVAAADRAPRSVRAQASGAARPARRGGGSIAAQTPRSPPRSSHGLSSPRAMRLAPLPLQPPPRTAPAGVSRSAGGSLSARATVGGSHSGGGTTSLPGGGTVGASTWRALTSRNAAQTSFAPHNNLAAAYDARQQLRSRLLKQQPDRGGGNPLLRVREIHSSAHPRSRTSMYGPFNLKIDAAASASHRDPAAMSHSSASAAANAAASAAANAAANAAEEQDCLRSPPYRQARAPMRFGKEARRASPTSWRLCWRPTGRWGAAATTAPSVATAAKSSAGPTASRQS